MWHGSEMLAPVPGTEHRERIQMDSQVDTLGKAPSSAPELALPYALFESTACGAAQFHPCSPTCWGRGGEASTAGSIWASVMVCDAST